MRSIKNIKKIYLIISVLLILLTILINYSFFKPTKINSFIASTLYNTPANSYFDDDNFYQCVVDAYNAHHSPDLPYTTVLTDEQLLEITHLTCNSNNIASVKGIEKLISLKDLRLNNNDLNIIDISKNVNLTILDLGDNDINTINTSENVKLEQLKIYGNNLKSLDLSKNINLELLNVQYNQFNSVDVSKNIKLEQLNIYSNNLKSLDLSNNINLELLNAQNNQLYSLNASANSNLSKLYLSDNNITTIDVSSNPNLEQLYLTNNYLTEIDVSQNYKLKDLLLSNNNITTIDVDSNPNLEQLYLQNNNITTIDVNSNPNLEHLYLQNNNVTTIDVSQNNNLNTLNLDGNNINFIDVSQNLNLTSLSLENNININSIALNGNIDLKQFPNQIINQTIIKYNIDKIIEPNIDYKYYVNEKVVIKENVNVSDFIVKLGLMNLVAKVYNGEEEVEIGNIEDGYKLKIYDGNIEIQDVVIRYVPHPLFEDENFYQCIVDAYNNVNGTDLSYTTILTDEELKTIIGLPCANKNIRSAKGIEKLTELNGFNLNTNKLTTIDISKNTKLESFDLSKNYLTTIDVSQNKKLTDFDLGHNGIFVIDIKENKDLTRLEIEDNKLDEIDISQNEKLTWLVISNNKLSELNISKNIYLESLNATNNNLSEIDISQNEKLYQLVISNNKLSELNTSKNIYLENLHVSNNNLSEIDISQNEKLTRLVILNNKLSELNISKNIYLENLYASNNNLSTIDISNNINLDSLALDHNNINRIDVSKNKKLTTLKLNNNKLSSIDIGENEEIKVIELYDNPLKLDDIYLHVNDLITENSDIKLPKNSEKFYITYEIEDQTIANYKEQEIKGIKSGMTKLIATLNGVEDAFSSGKYIKVSGNIIVYELVSDKYNIGEDYIYVGVETNSEIILLNTTIEGTDDLTKEIQDNKLLIKHNGETIKEFNIININSQKHDLTKDYVYVGLTELNINDIIIENNTSLTKEIKDNKLLIKDKDAILDEYLLTSISSSKYNLNKNYIYTNTNNLNLNDITIINGTKEIQDNKLLIKYDNDILKEFDIVSINSSKYDLTKDYIYIVVNNLNLNDITVVNGTKEIQDNKLLIKHNDEILKEFNIVSINSSNYNLTKDYIYIGVNDLNLNDITVVNGTKEIQNNKLSIKHNEETLKEYNILKIAFKDLNVTRKNILLTEDFSYETFTSNITTSEGLSYKIFNNEKEITSGNISAGMKLNVYYDNEMIDTYNITDEFIDLSLLNIDEDKKIIKENTLGLTIKDFKEKISTSGNITITDKNNKTLTDTDIIKTGAKVKIELSSETHEYTISLLGDVSGDGIIDITDISKAYQYFRKKITMTDCYIASADVANKDFKIEITDISKLYQYFRKRIDRL